MSSHPTAGLVGGVLVGTLLTIGLAARDIVADDDARPARQTHPARPAATRAEDVDAFLAAWRRSRTATWFARLRFTRRTAAGTELHDTLQIAQRPPDRLTVGPLGAVAGRLGGRVVNCATGRTGAVHCGGDQPAPDYRDEVARELATLRGYFEPPLSLYSVRADGRCFTIRLVRRYPSPPYGERARFCFDAKTGAPTRHEIHRREGSDVQEAVEIRARVSDSDLRLPAAA